MRLLLAFPGIARAGQAAISWRLAFVVTIACAALLLAAPSLVASSGGTTPDNAVDLASGPQSGSLAPGQETWYKIWDKGTNRALGVIMRFDPSPPAPSPDFTFQVWTWEHFGFPDQKFVAVGHGTDSSQPGGINMQPPNIKYWRGGTSVERTYYFQIMNTTGHAIEYTIAFTGEAYPPPAPPLGMTPQAGPTQAPTGGPSPVAPSGGQPPIPTVYTNTTYTRGESRQIAQYTVQIWDSTGPNRRPADSIITISGGGQPQVQVERVAKLNELTGQDINGDGYPDVVIDIYTGGAHCCFGEVAYSLGPTITKVMDIEPTNCAGRFEDLDGDGIYEWVTCDDAFAYRYCSWVDSPKVKVIMGYEPGRGYVPASPMFASQYDDDIAKHLDMALSGSPGSMHEFDGSAKCSVLPLVLDLLYSGQTEAAWAALQYLYPYPDQAGWQAELEGILSQSSRYVAP